MKDDVLSKPLGEIADHEVVELAMNWRCVAGDALRSKLVEERLARLDATALRKLLLCALQELDAACFEIAVHERRANLAQTLGLVPMRTAASSPAPESAA